MKKPKQFGHEMVERFSARKAGKGDPLRLERVPEGALLTSKTGEARLLMSDASRSVKGRRREAIPQLYAKHSRRLGLPIDMKSLGRASVPVKDATAQFLSFKPKVEGLEVDGAHVSMGVARNRKKDENWLLGLKSDAPMDRPVSGSFKMRRKDAIVAAADGLGIRLDAADASGLLGLKRVKVEKVLANHDGKLRRAFRVTPVGLVSTKMEKDFGYPSFAVTVDAESGDLLRKRPTLVSLTGQASAFDENPIMSPRNIDRASLIVDGRPAPITAGPAPHLLLNKHFNVVPGEMVDLLFCIVFEERIGERAQGEGTAGTEFLYQYHQYPHISEANAFVHLNRVRQMLLRVSPSFTNQTTAAAGKPLAVFVDVPASSFNALSSSGGELAFLSSGGVDAAIDASIVAHEYGHQVHFVLAPNAESREVFEAVADFVAAIYTHDTTISELFNHRNLVTSGQILDPEFSPGPYAGLREVYNDFRYPEDYTAADAYANSLIFSGALMELHHDWYSRGGGKNYHLVPRILLGALGLMPSDGNIRDLAFAYEVAAFVMALTGESDAARLFASMVRIFERRGLV